MHNNSYSPKLEKQPVPTDGYKLLYLFIKPFRKFKQISLFIKMIQLLQEIANPLAPDRIS